MTPTPEGFDRPLHPDVTIPVKTYLDGNTGGYMCKCATCPTSFLGYKGDVTCPGCVESTTAKPHLARATPSLAPEGQDDMDPTEWDAAHTRCEKCDEPYQVVRPGKIQPSCCCDYIASLHERINELELRVADLRAKQPEVGLTDTSSPEGFETITIPPGSPVHPPTPEAHKESDHA